MLKQNAIHMLLFQAAEPSAVISHWLLAEWQLWLRTNARCCDAGLPSQPRYRFAEEQAVLSTSYEKKKLEE